jgi:pimeloyl-ACP methyl ester carboxylesterase
MSNDLHLAGTKTPVPRPSGAFSVARTCREWIDPDRAEIYSDNPGDQRELVAWIWYPAGSAPGMERAPYLPEAWTSVAEQLGMNVAGLPSNAWASGGMADDQASYPVLIMSPSGFPPLLLSGTAEELASHGYIVVGVNHTYETTVTIFADGRVLSRNPEAIAGALGPQDGPYEEAFVKRGAVCDYKAADLRFVADRLEQINTGSDDWLAGRLDLNQLGAIGHSFGGAAALQWCRYDPRCRAAVNLDGAVWSQVGTAGLDRPALQVLAPHREFAVTAEDAVKAGMAPDTAWFEAEKDITFGGWRTVDRLARPGYTFQIQGATHLSFMDVPFLPVREDAAVTAMLSATDIAPERMWRIVGDLVLAFFARHLGGVWSDLLDQPGPSYPEVTPGPPR